MSSMPFLLENAQRLQQARVIPAMVTPFTADGEAIDAATLTQLAQYLVTQQHVDALLVNGTTGESPTTTLAEKITILKTVKSAVDVPVISGAGGNDTASAVLAARALVEAGADGLLVVVPYYSKPSPAGMAAHFTVVAKAVYPTPVIIYNIPGRVGVCMSPETMAELHAACPNIIGVKQSHPDMVAVAEITRQLPASFTVWSGDDPLTLPMLACGADGVVSVLAHAAGQPIQAIIRAFKAGQTNQALVLHQQLLPIATGLFTLPNPTIIKSILHQQGVLPNEVFRLPMVAPTPEELEKWVTPLVAQLNSLSQPATFTR